MIITAELVAQAGQMGLVTQREIGDGLVGVRELDGDRLLTVTVHSHPVAYVRREPTTSASTDGTLDRERAVLSAVQDTECVPQVLAGSPEESLWLSVLDGAELGEQRRNMAEYAEICQAWGATLGRLHTLPVRFLSIEHVEKVGGVTERRVRRQRLPSLAQPPVARNDGRHSGDDAERIVRLEGERVGGHAQGVHRLELMARTRAQQ